MKYKQSSIVKCNKPPRQFLPRGFITFLFLSNADRAAQDTVDIVRARADISQFAIIDSSNTQRYSLIRREFDANEMILYENAEEEVFGKFAANFIRRNTPIFKDQLTGERVPRNIYIYELGSDEELLTIPYRASEAGGEILLPGDRIRIRVTYDAEPTSMPQDHWNPNEFGTSGGFTSRGRGDTIMRTETLFDSVVVTDMLNSNNRSIFEIYSEVMRLSDAERQVAMQHRDFLSSIRPTALILAVSRNEANRYAQLRASVGTGNFFITLLGRESTNIDIENLLPIEMEVRSWLEGTR